MAKREAFLLVQDDRKETKKTVVYEFYFGGKENDEKKSSSSQNNLKKKISLVIPSLPSKQNPRHTHRNQNSYIKEGWVDTLKS